MTFALYMNRGTMIALVLICGQALSNPAWATSLAAHPLSQETAAKESPKNEIVKTYVATCRAKPIKQADCDRVRKEAIAILREDVLTLGSSANAMYLPTLLNIFKSHEPDLRIAAADAVGMIGPSELFFAHFALIANDPVPDVRKAASQMLQHGKGESLALLARRTGASERSGRTPETPPDPKKYGMPVAPESTYLFFASDATQGRLTYITKKNMKDNLAFFKQKAKKGPLELAAFKELYEKALDDEQEVREQAKEEAMSKMFSQEPPTDPAKMDAYLKEMGQAQSAMVAQNLYMLDELYPADVFGSPKVYVLEERKIGQRNYPTKYVVLYEDKALKRPGVRLCWMTLSDQAIKSAQTTSMMEETFEGKTTEENVAPVIKEKSEQERKKFNQGQSDLEKQLGF
ncbi:MAG: HEAT repeat domain-containing protein [Nitrospirota bacterium]|nr:HEAT repeat domain-containing protein [Nitrospirota bacterium]MDH5699472.1 HEAT repeat domain-containing protein [Nitrospirota bacterium]